MPGNPRVYISHAAEDNDRCGALLLALEAWGVDTYFQPVAPMVAQVAPDAQRAIGEREVFIRICSPAAQRSFLVNIETSTFRGLQAEESRKRGKTQRALINLIIDPGYQREPFDNATLFIDTTGRTDREWMAELARALGVSPVARRLSRRALLGLGAVGVVTVAAAGSAAAFLLDYNARTAQAKYPPGTQVWKRENLVNKVFPIIAAQNGVIYVNSTDSVLSLDAATGRTIWKNTGVTRATSSLGSPLVVGSTVYAGLDNTVYALNTQNGSTRWSIQLDDVIDGYDASSDLFALATTANLIVYSAKDGTKRWTKPVGTLPVSTSNDHSSDPLIDHDTIYIGGEDHYLYAFNVKDGSLRWKHLTRGPVESTPTVANGVVYVGSTDSYVYALNARDGSLRWRFRTGNVVFSSPTVRDGIVFVGSNDKHLYALDATTGAQFWRMPAGDEDSLGFVTGDPVQGQPIIDGTSVYVRAGKKIYAFNVRDGSRRWTYAPESMPDGRISEPAATNGLVFVGSDKLTLEALGG